MVTELVEVVSELQHITWTELDTVAASFTAWLDYHYIPLFLGGGFFGHDTS